MGAKSAATVTRRSGKRRSSRGSGRQGRGKYAESKREAEEQHASFEQQQVHQLATCWPLTWDVGRFNLDGPSTSQLAFTLSTSPRHSHFPFSALALGNRKRRRAIKIFATMKSYLCVSVGVCAVCPVCHAPT